MSHEVVEAKVRKTVLSEFHIKDLVKEKRAILDIAGDATVEDALKLMQQHAVLSLPVRHPRLQGMYQGIINIMDAVAAVVLTPIFSAYNTDEALESLDEQVALQVLHAGDALKQPIQKIIGLSEEPQVVYDSEQPLDTLVPPFCEGIHRVLVRFKDQDPHLMFLSQSDFIRFIFTQAHRDHIKDILNASLATLLEARERPPLVTVSHKAKAITAFRAMIREHVGAVAVVDDNGVIVEQISAFDLRGLTTATFRRLFLNVVEFLKGVSLKRRSSVRNALIEESKREITTATHQDTLSQVLARIAAHGIHRVWLVDDKKKLVGVVTLTDIIEMVSQYVKHSHTLSDIVGTSCVKLDHFQAIYRLDKVFEGCPNYRKVEGFPVYGTGQPTIQGFESVVTMLKEAGTTDILWTCMRQEPVIYVNNMSMAPRHRHNLNENMEFHGFTPLLLENLQSMIAKKLLDERDADGHVAFFQDTFAENPADRKNIELKEKLAHENGVQPLSAVFESLKAKYKISIDYHRLPIVDEKAPTPLDFDRLVELLQGVKHDTAIFFNCQMGKGRTTTGMVIAILMHRSLFGEHEDEKNALKPPSDDAPDYKRGEFAVIRQLLKALPDGVAAKEELDDAIDRAAHMQNLRDCIIYCKEMYDKETQERRDFWKRMAVNFLERYFYLICFNAYLRAAAPKFGSTFSKWVKDHKDLFAILGTRNDGALKEFHWQ